MTIMLFLFNSSVSKHTNNARQSLLLLETAADTIMHILSRFICSISKHLILLFSMHKKEQCAACRLPEVPVVGMFMLFGDFGYWDRMLVPSQNAASVSALRESVAKPERCSLLMYPWAEKTAVCFRSPSVKGVQFHFTCCCCWIRAHPSIQKGISLSTILLDREQCLLFVLFDAISRPSYVWPACCGRVFLSLLNHFTALAAGGQGHIFEANGECNLRWRYQLRRAARGRYTATIAALQHRANTREHIFKIQVIISEDHLTHSLQPPGD